MSKISSLRLRQKDINIAMLLRNFIVEGYKEVTIKFVAQGLDSAQVKKTLEQFRDLVDRNQVQGQERNIDWWAKNSTFADLTKFLQQKSLDTTKSQLKRGKALGRSVTIMETPQWLVVIPLDKDASCFHGRDSDWCTTKRNQNHYEDYFYNREIILIYCINKLTGQRWAIANYKHVDFEDDDINLQELKNNKWAELFDQKDNKLTVQEFQKQTGLDPLHLMSLSDQQILKGGAVKQRLSDRKVQVQAARKTLRQSTSQRNIELERTLIDIGSSETAYDYAHQLGVAGIDLGELPLKLQYLASMKISGVPIIQWIAKPDPKIVDISLKKQPSSLGILIDRNQITAKLLDSLTVHRWSSALIKKLIQKDLFSKTIQNTMSSTFHGIIILHNAGIEVPPADIERTILARDQHAGSNDVIVMDILQAINIFDFQASNEFFDKAGEGTHSSGSDIKSSVVFEARKQRSQQESSLRSIENNFVSTQDTLKIYQTKVNEYQAALAEITSLPVLSFDDKRKLNHITKDLKLYSGLLEEFKKSVQSVITRMTQAKTELSRINNVITKLSDN